MPQPTTPELVSQVRFLDLTLLLGARVRQALETVLDEELAAALGCGVSERSATRAGYRHGALTRDVFARHCPATLAIPRARLFG